MKPLLQSIKTMSQEQQPLPFSVYSSVKEQKLVSVPIIKPVFIAVLSGRKELGPEREICCRSGHFIFLSDLPSINMLNIPKDNEYLALLIEFEYEDFADLNLGTVTDKRFLSGPITPVLAQSLQQFVEYAHWGPQPLWPIRRKELIHLLCHMGHQEILSLVNAPKLGQRLHALISQQPANELPMEQICTQLAMSESTLRRKLKSEGLTLQQIKDQVKLGLGLHLLQTTNHTIAYIAQQCAYQSQSRFSARFKQRFGLTPSELRKTQMTD